MVVQLYTVKNPSVSGRHPLTIAGCISMPIGTGRTTGSFVAGAIRLAVGGLNHRTSSFVMCASSAREPGGTRPIAMRCWRFAVPSIMARSIGYSSGIDGAYEKRKNHRMLLRSVTIFTDLLLQVNFYFG